MFEKDLENNEINELHFIFNEIIAEKTESFKRISKEYYLWWQSMSYWSGSMDT